MESSRAPKEQSAWERLAGKVCEIKGFMRKSEASRVWKGDVPRGTYMLLRGYFFNSKHMEVNGD